MSENEEGAATGRPRVEWMWRDGATVVACLGVEPLFYGPFASLGEASSWVYDEHCNAEGYCPNNLEAEDHHVTWLDEPVYRPKKEG